MAKNIQGSRIDGSISTTGAITATGNITGNIFYGDGSGLTGVTTTTDDAFMSTVIPGYRLNGSTQKAYKLTADTVTYTTGTQTINGFSIYCQKFYACPGQKINELAFRIMTAGAAGTGLSQCRLMIYRTMLDSNGELVGGGLELDTAVNVSTLSAGIKVVTGLNHTLSNSTYKNVWYIAMRNYQSGTLSLKSLENVNVKSGYMDLSASVTTAPRDMSWYFTCGYTASTPTSMPAVSAVSPSTSAVAEWSQYLAIGYSAT